jgi:hypothetical protein
MGKYGRCAVGAVDRVRNREVDPLTAWNASARAVFPNSESSQKKGCPKDAFLGLCEEEITVESPAASTRDRYSIRCTHLKRSTS